MPYNPPPEQFVATANIRWRNGRLEQLFEVVGHDPIRNPHLEDLTVLRSEWREIPRDSGNEKGGAEAPPP
jgi:hypothetical protein